MLNETEKVAERSAGTAERLVWTRLVCSRCRYRSEHPGPVTAADLDGECGLCRAPLGAVTVFRIGPTGEATNSEADQGCVRA